MPELFRTRDCTVLFKDTTYTVVVSSEMVAGGWPGGQGVQWAGSADGQLVVTYSKGSAAGVLIFGSNEVGDDFSAISKNQPYWRFATMITGSSLLMVSSYEQFTRASRIAGPLVPITYSPNDELYFSLRGLWTNEDERTLSGDPAAPSVVAGYVAQVPKASNRNFLGIQTVM